MTTNTDHHHPPPRHPWSFSSDHSTPVSPRPISIPISSGLSALIQVATLQLDEAVALHHERQERAYAAIALQRSPRRATMTGGGAISSTMVDYWSNVRPRKFPRRSSDPGFLTSCRELNLNGIIESSNHSLSKTPFTEPAVRREKTKIPPTSNAGKSIQEDFLDTTGKHNRVGFRPSDDENAGTVAASVTMDSTDPRTFRAVATSSDSTSSTEPEGRESHSSIRSFPETLMTLAVNPAHADVIAFLPDGKYFAIRCESFVRGLLKHYFSVDSFDEFLGLCHEWGFTHIFCSPNMEDDLTSLSSKPGSSRAIPKSLSSQCFLHDALSRPLLSATLTQTTMREKEASPAISIGPSESNMSARTSGCQEDTALFARIDIFRHPHFIRNNWDLCRNRIRRGYSPLMTRLTALPERAKHLITAAVSESRMHRATRAASTANTLDCTGLSFSATILNAMNNDAHLHKRRLPPPFNVQPESRFPSLSHKLRTDSSDGDVKSHDVPPRMMGMSAQSSSEADSMSASVMEDDSDKQKQALHFRAHAITTETLRIRVLSSDAHLSGRRFSTPSMMSTISLDSSAPKGHDLPLTSGTLTSTTTKNTLVDQAVAEATHTIVTDALVTLLRDESHTRATYQKHHIELSKSCLPGVIPFSTQLFAPVEQSQGIDLETKALPVDPATAPMLCETVTSLFPSSSSKSSSLTQFENYVEKSAIYSPHLPVSHRTLSLDLQDLPSHSTAIRDGTTVAFAPLHHHNFCTDTIASRYPIVTTTPPLTSLEVLGAAVVEQQRRESLSKVYSPSPNSLPTCSAIDDEAVPTS